MLIFSQHHLSINNKARQEVIMTFHGSCGVIKTNTLCCVISNEQEQNGMTEYTFAATQSVVIVLSNTVDNTRSS